MEPRRSLLARLLEAAVIIALSGFLIKLGIGFLADVWVGLVIIATAICLGVAGYRIYKFWRDTRP